MINKRFGDKPMYFELSMGNNGNTLDGFNISSAKEDDQIKPPISVEEETGNPLKIHQIS